MPKLSTLVPILISVLGAALLVFALGYTVGAFRLFPHHYIKNAITAARSLAEVEKQKKFSVEILRPAAKSRLGSDGPVSVYLKDRAFDGVTMFTGFDGNRYSAVLVDMEGKTLHRWQKDFSAVWPNPVQIQYQATDDQIDYHGSWLYPNGDILLNYTAGNFPFGGGLAKLDKNSNVIWKVDSNAHHDIYVEKSGNILFWAHEYKHENPLGMSTGIKEFYEDMIIVLNPEGKEIDRIVLREAIKNSDFRGLLSLNYRDSEDIQFKDEDLDDPFHANALDVLEESRAAAFPMWNAGDIMVSLRNLNMIGVIDRKTKLMKWALVGLTVRQHDPDFAADGTIYVYDNRGHDGPGGRTRLLQIDPKTQKVLWSYTGSAQEPLWSWSRGKLQVLKNGNILTIEPHAGRVVEIARDGTIVWEYLNQIYEARGEPVSDRTGMVTDAKRFRRGELSFLQ
jgi:hypothetical protein